MPGFFAYKTVVWVAYLNLLLMILQVKLQAIKPRQVQIQFSLLAVEISNWLLLFE